MVGDSGARVFGCGGGGSVAVVEERRVQSKTIAGNRISPLSRAEEGRNDVPILPNNEPQESYISPSISAVENKAPLY